MGDLQPYQRPDLTPEETKGISELSKRIVHQTNYLYRLSLIACILIENAKLFREVNQHREALGYEPLPGMKIGDQALRWKR